MTRKARIVAFVCLSTFTPAVFPQQRMDPSNMYERILVVVRMVGKGTLADPRRPMYAPVPTAVNPTLRTGILGYSQVVSDDGNFSLVEFVAKDRAAFKDILNDKTLKPFLKGRDKREDAEVEFKKFKKDFDFGKFGRVRMP